MQNYVTLRRRPKEDENKNGVTSGRDTLVSINRNRKNVQLIRNEKRVAILNICQHFEWKVASHSSAIHKFHSITRRHITVNLIKTMTFPVLCKAMCHSGSNNSARWSKSSAPSQEYPRWVTATGSRGKYMRSHNLFLTRNISFPHSLYSSELTSTFCSIHTSFNHPSKTNVTYSS